MAQERLSMNKRAEQVQPREAFPLRGLLKSPCCGGGMTAGRRTGKKKNYSVYRCTKQSNGKISGKGPHEKNKALISHLNALNENIEYITERTKKKLKKKMAPKKKRKKNKKK